MPTDPALWDLRADNSQKGNGYLGLLQRPDGGVSSEISVGVNLGGKETEIPTMVPTLNPAEVRHLLNMNVGTDPIPQSILTKAVTYAHQRAAQGRPYFAQPGEEQTWLHPQFQRAQVTAPGATLMSPTIRSAMSGQPELMREALVRLLDRK